MVDKRNRYKGTKVVRKGKVTVREVFQCKGERGRKRENHFREDKKRAWERNTGQRGQERSECLKRVM